MIIREFSMADYEAVYALRAKGCLKVNLLVHRDNQAARRLYKRLSYEEMSPFIAVGKEL